jgi:hypothetical protein
MDEPIIYAGNPNPVPQSVTMRQARLALSRAGKLDDVQAAIDALPEPDKTEALIEWDYSNAVERNRDFVQMIGLAIGYDSEELDELFIQAEKL